MSGSNWTAKGGALSDKSAREEYGLTQAEIHEGIRNGDLQYRENHMHGNPYLRLLRDEVEDLIKKLRGPGFMAEQKLRTNLKKVERQIRSCKSKLKKLEKEKIKFSSELEKMQAVV